MSDDRDPLLAELDAVRAELKAARQTQVRSSRIDRFKGELLRLHKGGATTKELAFWLRTRRRTRVHPTTVLRRLAQWREGPGD